MPIQLFADSFSNGQIKSLSKEDGLSGETVTDIVTGPDGQVWIATNDGVCRYNGREVTTFAMPRKGRKPNYTFDIEFAADRTLYAGTKEGLFRLKRGENAFKHIYPSLTNVETVLTVGNDLFVGNRQGFHVLKNGKVKTVTVGATPMGIENGVRDIQLGEDKAVWFVSRYALNRYDQKTGKVTSYDLAHLLPERSALANLIPVAGHFFIGTKNNGLYIYSPRSKTVSKVNGIGNSIGSILKTSDNKVCIAGSGAYLLDGKTGKILRQFTRRTKDGKGELPTEAVYYYYRDGNGVDWFGLYRYGLCYSYHSEQLFKIYGFGNFSSEGLDVRSVLVNGRQKVIGTNDDLWLVDEARNIVRHYTSEQLGNAHAIASIAYFNGCYYVGSFDTGLHRFSANTFDKLPNPPEPLLSTVTIGTLKADGRGNLWIGTSEGLFILDSKDHLQHYTENNSKIIGGQVSAICFMPKGTAWIGGPTGLSISLFQGTSLSFEKANFPKGFFGSVNVNEINVGHNGMYFFNSGSTVYYSDAAMHDYGEFATTENLTFNNCVSFLDDLKGHYWIATSDGLFCSDYALNDILHFGYGEGLRCQLIAGKMYMDSTGTVWVCTSNGLMSVHMADLKRWQKQAHYKILLYHIAIDGNPASLGLEDDVNDYKRLSLKWNITSSVMSVRPLLADFARPYGRIYEYRIDTGSWQIVRDGEDIILHNLFLGRHHLQVRLAGAPGTLAVYSITVSPSVWAILELILLIVAIAALVLWFRYHKNAKQLLAERNEIEDALVESEELRGKSEEVSEERRLKSVESDAENNHNSQPSTLNAQPVKYEKVHIDESESKIIVDRLKKYIETDKVYLNPDLKMSDLADYLHLSPSKLSQVFSLYLKENWYDFINSYRLAEFKRLIDEGAYKQYTLLALSAKCGFRKSSFFSTFRKVEGMTPTEYMKKVKR